MRITDISMMVEVDDGPLLKSLHGDTFVARRVRWAAFILRGKLYVSVVAFPAYRGDNVEVWSGDSDDWSGLPDWVGPPPEPIVAALKEMTR